MDLFFDRAGRPLPGAGAWSRLQENRENVKVAITDLPDGVRVSTVWVGISVGFFDPPLIFETKVLGMPRKQATWRYATEAEAVAGHDQIVAAVRSGREPW